MSRDYETYKKPSVSQSPFILSLYDIIGGPEGCSSTSSDTPPCLVLEWMDYTLADIPSKAHRKDSALIRAIVEAGLLAITTLANEGLVHTDIKPNNVLVSDLGTPRPRVKIGDLGLGPLLPCSNLSLQRKVHTKNNSLPNRFQRMASPTISHARPRSLAGHGCTPTSEAWSLAVTILDWIQPGVFGFRDIKDGHWPEPWCLAKLMRLFPVWNG